ncbi:17897_t:CDS:2, partial [Cetraspora pellucida]
MPATTNSKYKDLYQENQTYKDENIIYNYKKSNIETYNDREVFLIQRLSTVAVTTLPTKKALQKRNQYDRKFSQSIDDYAMNKNQIISKKNKNSYNEVLNSNKTISIQVSQGIQNPSHIIEKEKPFKCCYISSIEKKQNQEGTSFRDFYRCCQCEK